MGMGVQWLGQGNCKSGSCGSERRRLTRGVGCEAAALKGEVGRGKSATGAGLVRGL